MKGKLLFAGICFLLLSCSLRAQTNYALSFDGVDDYVSFSNIPVYNMQNVTVEFWMYWINNTHPDNVSFILSRNLNEMEIHTAGSGWNQNLRFIPTAGVYLDTDKNLYQPNQWYHVAFVYNSSAGYAKCYINGEDKALVKSGPNPLTTSITNTFSAIRLGRRKDNWYPFHGKLDEFRLWNKARSQAEIMADMNRELNGDEEGLVAYFKMNENGSLTATDYTSNGNNATLQGPPFWVVNELALPVELISFSAQAENSVVSLNWQTATEVNNYGFEVERKYADGQWEKIGFVEGYRNSNTAHSYSFQDKVTATGKYLYRLKQIDADGSFIYSAEQEVSTAQPSEFSLRQNYPNPFNPSTKISYSLPADCRVKIDIYNTTGELIETLTDRVETAGVKEVVWNAQSFPSGMYIVNMKAFTLGSGKDFSATGKLLLVK